MVELKSMEQVVRTRIPPSPTGVPHVGTAYMALLNYAFAKKHGGKLIFRLEDTDIKRNIAQAEEAIYDALHWLGLSWDEGPDVGGPYKPYRQSERLDLYCQKAAELVQAGFAYQKDGAVWSRSPQKDIAWEDVIHGLITFPADSDQAKDFVILRSDGYPTYNFAAVVDDIAMEITHVIRGEDHISNTPRQLILYKAFGKNPPEFAHFPVLRNLERAKLSKRKDPVDVRGYRDEGYLPMAFINFLCLLGWSHPEGKEIFSLDEFVSVFDLGRMRRAGPVFDANKLLWMNGEYIRKTQNSKLKSQIWEYTGKQYPQELIEQTIPLVKNRIKTLADYKMLAGFFFNEPEIDVGLFPENAYAHLDAACKVINQSNSWDSESLHEALLSAISENEFKTGDFFMSLRVAVAGSKITPPIVESIVILGKEKAIERINNTLKLVISH